MPARCGPPRRPRQQPRRFLRLNLKVLLSESAVPPRLRLGRSSGQTRVSDDSDPTQSAAAPSDSESLSGIIISDTMISVAARSLAPCRCDFGGE